MSRLIDKRPVTKKKSTVNRQRFLRRYKSHVRKAVDESIKNRHISDIETEEHIVIPKKDLSEPTFKQGQGGERETVLPGNKEFISGDKLKKPEQAQGAQGSKASNKGEGEDEFVFKISKEEFLNIFFDDLELPDMIKKQMISVATEKFIRSGYKTTGVPSNLNIGKSLIQAKSRKIALKNPLKKQLIEKEQALKALSTADKNYSEKKIELEHAIETLKKKIRKIPFIDDFDLRYNNKIKTSLPTTQAVMFCLMDVSGSMDEDKKNIAKRFFILLYLFLKKNYEKIELVFIRHHISAKEVSETEFFNSKETGGTIISSALILMRKILEERYDPKSWNIYAAQASDGDNWSSDSPKCRDILVHDIMPKTQYFAYTEIMPRYRQSLWESYTEVAKQHPSFSMQVIHQVNEIYSVFRELFKRQAT